jgi:hypothetical protein
MAIVKPTIRRDRAHCPPALSALILDEASRWYRLVGATVVLAGVVLATAK